MKILGVFLFFILTEYWSLAHTASLANILYGRYVCVLKANGYRTLVPGSCNQYYECQNGRAKLRSCPYYFDGKGGVCVTSNPGCVESVKASPFVPAGCYGPCCGVASGYVMDTINPRVYYKCQNNRMMEEHECEEGMVFNPVKLECDTAAPQRRVKAMAASMVNKEAGDLQTMCKNKSDGFAMASSSSCHEFYVCLKGKAVLRNCGVNYFNDELKLCDIPENSKCQIEEVAVEEQVHHLTKTGRVAYDDLESYLAKERSNIEAYLSMVCLAKPNGFQLASLTNCHEFYMCVGGKTVLQTCGESYYNSERNICDLPDNTECIVNVIRSSSDVTAAAEQQGNNPHSNEEDGLLKKVEETSSLGIDLYKRFVCRGKPNGELLVSVAQCNEYYQCHGGEAVTFSCGPYLHFNARRGVCDLPKNSKCLLGQQMTPAANAEDSIKPTTGNTKLYERFVCRDKPDGHQLISLTNCHEYYVCQGGAVSIRSCGLKYFNIQKGECDLPENTQCLVQKQVVSKPSSISDLYQRFICRNKANGVRLISTHSCNEYYTCQDGKATLQSCGHNYFNGLKGICDLPENTKCLLKSQNFQLQKKASTEILVNPNNSDSPADLYQRFVCRGKADGHILISPNSCNEFYECRQESLIVHSCGEKYYNHAKGICDLPENTKCVLKTQSTVVEPTSDAPRVNAASAKALTSIDFYERHICRGKPDGSVLISIRSCNEFYFCENGKTIVKSCGELYFNGETGVCDLPERSRCLLAKN
ncbi:uncharacterized protein [Musca autumnalis]|uniref:uncharacterized protein n=1 Tax=Musca autumnalis TaxID=221902 RepID=UPI003CF5082C